VCIGVALGGIRRGVRGHPARNLTGRSGNTSFLSGPNRTLTGRLGKSKILPEACQDNQDD